MSSNKCIWLTWFLPFLVSGGMAFGSLMGMTSLSDAATQEGPAGDIAGAAGALIVVICTVVGFIMAMLTILVAKVLHRSAPNHIVLRLGLSIASGYVLGSLGSHAGYVATAIAWLLLLGTPVLLAWPWQAEIASDVETLVK